MKRLLSLVLSLSIVIGSFVSVPMTTSAENLPSVPSDAVEFNGHYYKVFDVSKSWTDANAYCGNLGGHLVTINSQEEQDFLIALVKTSSKKNMWIGASANASGIYSWVTGEVFLYKNWAPGEPNNVFDSQYTAMMYTHNASYAAGLWNDENENGRDWAGYRLSDFGFICEWGKEQNDQSADGTMRFNGHCYRMYNLSMTWEEAKEYCENLGGHLVTITSQEEQDALTRFLSTNIDKNYLYIGLNDLEEEGKWQWVTGEPFSFCNWAKYQPDNATNEYCDGQDYGGIKCGQADAYSSVGQWDDMGTVGYSSGTIDYRGFICEWETDEIPIELTDAVSPEKLLSDSWESQAITFMSDYLATAVSAPKAIVYSYQTNSQFMNAAAGWEMMDLLAEPASNSVELLSHKTYYTTIILNLLDSYISSEGVLQMIESNALTDSVSIASNFAKIIEQCDELDFDAFMNGKPFTIEDLAIIFKRVDKIDKGTKQIGAIKDVLGYMADFEHGCQLAVNYIGLKRVKDDMVTILNKLKANTNNPYYLYALQETTESIESTFAAHIQGIYTGTMNFATKQITSCVDDMWQEVVKSNPYTAAMLFGYKIGKPLTNMVFNTDATISNYYEFLALREVEQSVVAALGQFRDAFYANKNDTTALNYIRAVSMYFNVQYICCDYVESFNEIANRCPYAELFRLRQGAYQSVADTWRGTRASLENFEYTLFRLWSLELRKQYPDIYEAIADEVGDIYSTDLKNATVRAEYFATEYTGKAHRPSVTVCINGSPLIEGVDYVVSYANNVSAGRAQITVTPAAGSMFSGQASGSFMITSPTYTKRYALKSNNSYVSAYSLRAVKQTNIPNMTVRDAQGVVVAAIENGDITCDTLPVIINGNNVDIYMYNEEYTVEITSADETMSHVEVASLDESGNTSSVVTYTDVPTATVDHSIYADSDLLVCADNTVEPTYRSEAADEYEAYTVTVQDGITTAESAHQGEIVYIDATVGKGKLFLGWNSDNTLVADSTEESTYFIMKDHEASVWAEFALLGDVDQNDILNTYDAAQIMNYALQYEEVPDALTFDLADYNGDGKVNTLDVRYTLIAIVNQLD